MKSIELKAFGKPHNVTISEGVEVEEYQTPRPKKRSLLKAKRELKTWSERNHYDRDDDWEPLEKADMWFIGLAFTLIGVFLLWVWVRYG